MAGLIMVLLALIQSIEKSGSKIQTVATSAMQSP